ncbi:hypothetical protein PMIN05_005822, partial [Paraphaeosphaeria minitans]
AMGREGFLFWSPCTGTTNGLSPGVARAAREERPSSPPPKCLACRPPSTTSNTPPRSLVLLDKSLSAPTFAFRENSAPHPCVHPDSSPLLSLGARASQQSGDATRVTLLRGALAAFL